MNIIANDVSRCSGELLGENWGDSDRVCERREHCKRHIQFILDHVHGANRVPVCGWCCSSDEYECFIPDGFELQIEQDGV